MKFYSLSSGSSGNSTLIEKEKIQVISNATTTHNADLLVAPLVNVQTDAQSNIIISVSGYPAKYKNYRRKWYSRNYYLQKR